MYHVLISRLSSLDVAQMTFVGRESRRGGEWREVASHLTT